MASSILASREYDELYSHNGIRHNPEGPRGATRWWGWPIRGLDSGLPPTGWRALSTYARRLGGFTATMAVVGGIIGSGIFLNPAIVARRVRSGLPAFLYGWALLLVMSTGAMAAVAVTFANYTLALLGLPATHAVPVAVVAILVLTAVNYVGVAPGAWTQNLFTILKLAALAFLIVAGLLREGAPAVAVAAAVPVPAPVGAWPVAVALGAAMVPVLFAYGGWQQTNFIAEELEDAEHTLPRALLGGTALVVLVYLLANLAYLRVLGADGLAASSAPAADVLDRVVGPTGKVLISAGIAASTFGFLDLVILVSPRVYQAMAADGAFLPALARLHPRWRTPTGAIVLQGAWAVALTLTGTYGQLLDYVVFGDWIFFGLTAATLFVYRRRHGPPARFGTPWWPITPLAFIAAAVAVVASSVASNPRNALMGSLLLAAGVPFYVIWRRKSKVEGRT